MLTKLFSLSFVLAFLIQSQRTLVLTSLVLDSPNIQSLAPAPDLSLRGNFLSFLSDEDSDANEPVDDISLAKDFLGPKSNRSRLIGSEKEYCRPTNEWIMGIPKLDVLPGESKEDIWRRFRQWMPACVDDDSFNFAFYAKFWPDFKQEKVPRRVLQSWICPDVTVAGARGAVKRRRAACVHKKSFRG